MERETIRIQLNYPSERVQEPVLYRLVKDYGLIPNIRRANIDRQTGGYIFLELNGVRESLDSALRYLDALGIEVGPIGLDGSEEWAI